MKDQSKRGSGVKFNKIMHVDIVYIFDMFLLSIIVRSCLRASLEDI